MRLQQQPLFAATCWWPGTVAAGSESGYAGSFADVMATAAALADVPPPPNTDSLSLVPELTGHHEQQAQHEYLYWEFHEGGFRQACLYNGRWKGLRRLGEPLRLYDTDADVAEKTDVAAEHPDLAEKLAAYLDTARWPNPNWEPKPRR